ncbi:hypothetical protein D9M69_602780 [compost metagenome]
MVMGAFQAAADQGDAVVGFAWHQFDAAATEWAIGREAHEANPFFSCVTIHLQLARVFSKRDNSAGRTDHPIIEQLPPGAIHLTPDEPEHGCCHQQLYHVAEGQRRVR